MKNIIFLLVYFAFYFGYVLSEKFIQPNMHYSQFVRHHLSDVFAAPVITQLLGFGFVMTFKLKQSINFLVPVINMCLCIIYEYLSKTDVIDIYAYIFGTLLFYIIYYLTLKISLFIKLLFKNNKL